MFIVANLFICATQLDDHPSRMRVDVGVLPIQARDRDESNRHYSSIEFKRQVKLKLWADNFRYVGVILER